MSIWLKKISVAEKSLKLFIVLILFLYVMLLLTNPQLGPSDEYAFLPTLQSGKYFPMYGENFPYYNSVELGRFSPLAGQEYNLAAFFAHTPTAYFLLNAIELILAVIFLGWVIGQFCANRAIRNFALLVLFIIPGVTLTYFKLLYIERNVLMLLAVFLFSYLQYLNTRRIFFFVSTLLLANLAIYYKEPVFVAVGAFSGARLFLGWIRMDRKEKLLDVGLLLSALTYIGLYFAYIMPKHIHPMPGVSFGSQNFIAFIKNSANYGLYSDPLIILVFIPLTFWRAYKVLFRREEPHMVVDPMLAAGTLYAAVFFSLNMYSPYYMLPVYVFAFPSILYFVGRGLMAVRVWKGLILLTGFIFFVNSAPLALHYLTYNKYVAVNFNSTLDFLVDDINKRYAGTEKRLNIFFDGVDRGDGRGVYFIAGEFLKYKGLSIDKFDLCSSVEAANPRPFIGKPSPLDVQQDVEALNQRYGYTNQDFPFTVFQPGQLPDVKNGDYLIVSPQSTRNFDREYIERLKKDFNLVFYTRSPFAIPRIDLKTLVKYLLLQKLSSAQRAHGVVQNENLWNWPDYYVFIKK